MLPSRLLLAAAALLPAALFAADEAASGRAPAESGWSALASPSRETAWPVGPGAVDAALTEAVPAAVQERIRERFAAWKAGPGKPFSPGLTFVGGKALVSLVAVGGVAEDGDARQEAMAGMAAAVLGIDGVETLDVSFIAASPGVPGLTLRARRAEVAEELAQLGAGGDIATALARPEVVANHRLASLSREPARGKEVGQ
jgi:hypothetical protein